MSTVTVTDLPPGTAAIAGDVNATMTSWVNGTAAGQIGAINVRQEGIDRRSLSGANHVVFTEETGTNTIVESTASSGAVTNVTGAYIVVTAGIALQTNSMTISTSSRVLLHAALSIGSIAIATAPLPRVWVALQQSTDAGATWITLTGTAQYFEMREVGVSGGDCDNSTILSIPGIAACPAWCVSVSALGGAVLYRIGFQTQNGSVRFESGTIFPEILSV